MMICMGCYVFVEVFVGQCQNDGVYVGQVVDVQFVCIFEGVICGVDFFGFYQSFDDRQFVMWCVFFYFVSLI